MKVKATDQYQKLNVQDSQLNRIPKEGEEFEVTKERFNVLNGNNDYKVIFVNAIQEKKVETAKKDIETEKAVKKTTKKSK